VLYADQLGIVFGELYDGEGQRRWSEHALALEPRVDTYRERVVQAELCVRGDTVAARQFVEATEWASDLEERRALGLLAFYRGDAERAEELWREVPRSARDLAVFRHVVGDPAGAATIADSIIPLLQDTLETAVLVGARYRPQQPGEPWSTRGSSRPSAETSNRHPVGAGRPGCSVCRRGCHRARLEAPRSHPDPGRGGGT